MVISKNMAKTSAIKKSVKKPIKTSANPAVKPVLTNLKGQTLVCLRTLKEKTPASLASYEKLGGYIELKRLVIDKVKAKESKKPQKYG